jgi:hypothetical protein
MPCCLGNGIQDRTLLRYDFMSWLAGDRPMQMPSVSRHRLAKAGPTPEGEGCGRLS